MAHEPARDGNISAKNQNEAKNPDITIKYEVNGEPRDLRLMDVSLLFLDLEKYNNQFSMGAMLGRAIGNAMKLDEPEPAVEATVREEEASQQANAFFLAGTHKNTLESLGLSVEPVTGSATLNFNGESASSGEMRFNISNQDALTAFLGVIKPNHLAETSIKNNLDKLAHILTRQVADHYNFSDMILTEDMSQLFGSMEKIIDEYKRLGLNDSIRQLAVYLEHGKIGDLREFVSIERRGLFNKPGESFGPADWQRDSSPESLRNRWNAALHMLQQTKENPKAASLASQLQSHLSMCVNTALQNVTTLNYLSPVQQEESAQVLREAKEVLEPTNTQES